MMINHLLTLAESLIAIPSVTPQDLSCQQLLANKLSEVGFTCEHLRFAEVDNLWARFGTQSPLLLFVGHTDVVPEGASEEWTYGPFVPTIKDGLLYGRGASDMKAAIAAMVTATCGFIKNNKQFKGSIAFILTSDEEGEAINGTAKVIETLNKRGLKIEYCLVGEPSSLETVGDQIRIGRRGSLHAKVRIYGKQGHVAHPHLAQNPIHLSASAIAELANSQWDQGNEHYPPSGFQISNVQSGTGALNVIPSYLEFFLNFRYGTAVTTTYLKDKVEAILNKHKLTYQAEWRTTANPFLTQQGRLLESVKRAISTIKNIEPQLSTGGGTSDGRFIAPFGTEVIELGLSHKTAHQIDEHISIEDLENLQKIYYKILELLFS